MQSCFVCVPRVGMKKRRCSCRRSWATPCFTGRYIGGRLIMNELLSEYFFVKRTLPFRQRRHALLAEDAGTQCHGDTVSTTNTTSVFQLASVGTCQRSNSSSSLLLLSQNVFFRQTYSQCCDSPRTHICRHGTSQCVCQSPGDTFFFRTQAGY